MKASYNWIKDYLQVDIDPERFGEILTDIGLEVEGIEKVESILGGLEGIIAGEVKTCIKHPNADRLSLTTVNIGGNEDLQIICGAPNVAAGQKVWVAQVGTTLYTKEGEPWLIKKAKVRGEFSEGMICSEDEIGLGDLHEGIMVLEPELEVGSLAKHHYDVELDYVFEIGLTPNRSDATCHVGIAEDVHAYLVINEEYTGEFRNPDVSGFAVDDHALPIDVKVINSEACPRYAGVSISNIQIGESPEWLKNRLQSIGVRAINNVVDATNYVLHEMGQPLHAFDIEKISNRQIIVKTLPDQTVFKSLDEVDRKLSDKDLIICDGASYPMCIGGVFGGIGSGVTDQTHSIFLESAHFDAQWIRRTSTRHQLRTDAAKVFEKGSDPNIAVKALKRAAVMIKELTGGKISSEVVDIYPKVILPTVIEVKYAHVNRLIGTSVLPEEINHILEALKMQIVHSDESSFSVAVPTNKADVTREADVIEEILRIYGYNNVPIQNKMTSTISITERPPIDRFRKMVGDYLAANGCIEIMGLSLTQSSYYEKVMPVRAGRSLVPVLNTSNTNLDIMRPDLLVSALETVAYNQNRQQTDMRLFEFGRHYNLDGDEFEEEDRLTITLSGQNFSESWLQETRTSDFYTIKRFVEQLLLKLGLTRFKSEKLVDDLFFSTGLSIQVGPKSLVKFGIVNPQILSDFDVRNSVLFADFDMELLYRQSKRQNLIVEELSKYPSVTRDLALILDKAVQFADLQSLVKKEAGKLLKSVELFDVYDNEKHVGKGKKSSAIRLTFENPEKTMTDKTVDAVVSKVVSKLEKELGATLR
jgi:phenylalanyl-tRNA synthetase beta chain